jgi:hypothetical protein
MRTQHLCFVAALLAGLAVTTVSEANEIYGLKPGNVDLLSAGPLAFGPDGILFVADPQAATIYAIDTGDKKGDPSKANHNIDALNQKVSELLGGNARINDIKANPESGNLFLAAVARGQGPAIVKIEQGGQLSRLSLEGIPHSKVELPDAPGDEEIQVGRRARNLRTSSITDMAWTEGELLVAGAVGSTSPAAVRSILFPFQKADRGTNIEIFHAAHGRSEDYAIAQTVVPLVIGGEPSLLAGFVCTPLVKFPINAIKESEKVTGTTVAELGNRNRPLDMIVYEKDGQTWLLSANSARGVMKISTENIEQQVVTEPVRGGGTSGQSYETIEGLDGVVQLDKLNATHAVVLIQPEEGVQNLQTIPLP